MDLPFLANNSTPRLYPESGYNYPNTLLTDTQYAQKVFMRCNFANDEEQKENARESLRTFKQVAFLCAIFMVSEFVGGVISNSVAVYSDALHMLSDMTGYFINIFGLVLSMRKPSPFFTFGSRRVEIVGAIFSILLIWILSLFLVMKAAGRIINPPKVSGPIMVIVASLGIVTNVLIAGLLFRSGHGHSHFGIKDHGHGHERDSIQRESSYAGYRHRNSDVSTQFDNKVADESEESGLDQSDTDESHVNISIKSAYLHTLGDLIQNVGVLLAGVMIWINPKKFQIMDPICTLFFAFNVFAITVPTAFRCFYVLMETVPKSMDTTEMLSSIRNIKYVQDVRDFHVWSVGMEKQALTVSLAVSGDKHGCNCSKRSGVTEQVRGIAQKKGITHCNVEIRENSNKEKRFN